MSRRREYAEVEERGHRDIEPEGRSRRELARADRERDLEPEGRGRRRRGDEPEDEDGPW